MAVKGKVRLYKNWVLKTERYYFGKAARTEIIERWKATYTTYDKWHYDIAPHSYRDKPLIIKKTNGCAKKTVEVDKEGNTIAEYNSVLKAAPYAYRVCSGKQSNTFGRYFKYAQRN